RQQSFAHRSGSAGADGLAREAADAGADRGCDGAREGVQDPLRTAQDLMNAWTNWAGYVKAAPQQIAKPTTEAELAALVRDGPAPVRVAGTGHSSTPLVETNGTLLSLDGIAGVVRADAAAQTATVRAGAKIHALGRPLFDAGLALKNQGDIDRQ